MGSTLVKLALGVGLGCILLFALPLFSITVTDPSMVYAAEPLDLNSATADQLKALSGIGNAEAQAIIHQRPYSKKEELLSKAGIPQATYDKIRDQIVAKQK